jgi:hypothetical protein
MPVESLLVDGKRYLYFYYYDRGTKRKERIYCGPVPSADSQRRARELEDRYLRFRRLKDGVNLQMAKLLRLQITGDVKATQKQRQAIIAVLAESQL